MLLDALAAKALAALIVISTQGADILARQMPLNAEDQGDSWLIKSTPYTEDHLHLQHCMVYMFIRKDTAEIVGLDFAGRQILSGEQKAYWSNFMTPEQYAGVFGPLKYFERNGVRDIYLAAYGGLINKPQDAIEYAYVLMQTKPGLANIPKANLEANEIDTPNDKVWHVVKHEPAGLTTEVLSFSRKTGKLLSGAL